MLRNAAILLVGLALAGSGTEAGAGTQALEGGGSDPILLQGTVAAVHPESTRLDVQLSIVWGGTPRPAREVATVAIDGRTRFVPDALDLAGLRPGDDVMVRAVGPADRRRAREVTLVDTD
jgi:hypothetical protein